MKRTMIAAVLALSLVSGVTAVTELPDMMTASITAQASDKSEIAAHAGKYTLDVKLLQHMSDDESMGNGAFNQTATLVVEEDGTAYIEVGLHSMPYLDKVGYLGSMKLVTAITKTNKFGYPTEFETEDAEILEEYENVYDDFNLESSEYADSNVVGKWYPKRLAIPVEVQIDSDGNITGVPDEDDDTSVLVQVYVPVMESLGEGQGTKFARFSPDWSSVKTGAAELEGSSVSVSGDISLNNYISLSDEIKNDSKASVVTVLPDGTEVTESASSGNECFTVDIPAKDMTSEITVKVVNGDGEVVSESTVSIADYAMDIINGDSYSESAKTMAKAMLNYGAAAQNYFGTNTDTLANAELSDTDKSLDAVTETTLSGYDYKKTGSISGLEYKGSSLVLVSETTIKHYFAAESTDNLTFTVKRNNQTETLTPAYDSTNNLWYVSVEGISAKNLAEKYEVSATDGKNTFTLNYGAMDYCKLTHTKSSDEKLKNVAKSLYLFWQAAENYSS